MRKYFQESFWSLITGDTGDDSLKSADILSTFTSKSTIAYSLNKFIDDAALKGRTLNLKRIVGAYFSAAKYSEIERGILLKYNPLNNAITCSYDYIKANPTSKKRTVTLPIFDEWEYSMAERLFDMLTVDSYVLRNPEKLGVTLKFLRSYPYEIDKLFGIPFNTTSLRTLRLYALLNDYKVSREQVWSLYIRDYDQYFGVKKTEAANSVAELIKKAYKPSV
jgi:hypothetical protein